MLIEILNKELNERSLLKHPFYQLWNEGKLNQEILADYSEQYYKHVEAFPRYISLIHSKCEDLSSRQVLLENLIEEERGEENHPKLWRDFAISLGSTEEKIKSVKYYKATDYLVNNFFKLCQQSYAAGLGALYAYEHQTPEVAKTKIEGLKNFYNITEEKALKFFEVHQKADIWHSEEVAGLLNKLTDEEKKEAFAAAISAADSLLKFLDGIVEAHNLNVGHC